MFTGSHNLTRPVLRNHDENFLKIEHPVLDRHCEQVGRDPATIRRAVQFPLPDDADEILRMVERYAEAGFHDILFMPFHGGLARVDATAALLAELRSIS